MNRLIIATALGLSLAACGAEESAPEPTEPPTEAVTETEVEPEAVVKQFDDLLAAAPTAEEMPLPEDFAEEAEQEINAENLEAELAALESELGEE